MHVPKIFQPDRSQVQELIAANPLATVMSFQDDWPLATPLPLLLREDGEGQYLLGHFSKRNPQVKSLQKNARAMAVFLGPHGYVSPSWCRDRSQAPTWNFAMCQFVVDVEFTDNATASEEAVNELTNALEKNRPNSWHSKELGERYDKLLGGIIAFRARVIEQKHKFKLGQNERQDVYEDVLQGLEENAHFSLADLMRRQRTQ